MQRFAALCLAVAALSVGGTASADVPPQVTPGADVYSGYAAVAPSFRVLTAHWKQTAVTCPPSDLSGLAGGVTNTVMTGASMLRIPGLLAVPEGLAGTLFIPHVAMWIGMVGMNGATDRNLIQTGTSTLCAGGVAHNMGFFETPSFSDQAGEPIPDADAPGVQWETPPTDPGDDITAAITWDGAATYRLTLADTTKGWQYGATHQSRVVPTAALTVFESIPYNVPGFTPVTFTDITADGKPLAAYHPQPLTISSPRISPTPLSDNSFTVPAP
ncbi:G1 family glutamic endopeptidase [Nocardia sp. NPDC051570]|uniref:G1 family glutamic endopeptidase n=1 Tax=Nocardia sp. NPDC051570 TaxID=3364324 RepID=UPI0037BCDE77